jgi:hypothetical protein
LIRNQQKAAPSALSCMQCHALVQARLLGQNRCSFLPFPSLSPPLPPAPFSSPSRSLITAEFFQPHIPSQSLSPPLSLFFLSGPNQGRFRRRDPSSTGRCTSRRAPPGPYMSSTPLPRRPLNLLPSSACFVDAAVRSSPPSDRRLRFRLQGLPGPSASKTPSPRLAFGALALFRVVRSPLDHGPESRALQRTRCRE